MDLMKRSYGQILEVAEAHEIIVNIEPHGYFTTKPDLMAECWSSATASTCA